MRARSKGDVSDILQQVSERTDVRTNRATRTDACSLSRTFVVFSASSRSNQSTTEDIGQSRLGRCSDVR
jgi:hypothetical protein